MAIILQRISTAINASFLTSATAKSVTTRFIVADDNFVSSTGTSWNILKELRFVRNSEDFNSNTLLIKTETMSLQGTTNIGVFLNSEALPRKILSTVGTTFELLQGTTYIGDLSDGVHSIQINSRNLDNGTSYQRLVELWEKI